MFSWASVLAETAWVSQKMIVDNSELNAVTRESGRERPGSAKGKTQP